ncbi:MAG: helix-turn-helix domain-containing protein [Lachnospiraceae bacterium]|nr:helix-turn-helix domain-containing protein [Lachnospiraceae bacterium]
MGKKASKAVGNIYYNARCSAAETEEKFSSRESASDLVHIERTRLANIELGNITPYPEEVKMMAEAYNLPELCNSYCARECPIGRGSVQEVQMDDFDRLSLRVLGSLQDIDKLRDSLIEISEDGVVAIDEQEKFNNIIDALEKISNNAKALQLWAKKNIRFE